MEAVLSMQSDQSMNKAMFGLPFIEQHGDGDNGVV